MKLRLLLPVTFLLAAISLQAQTPQRGHGPWNLTLFHFNDTHAVFEAEPASWLDNKAPVGGVIALQAHLREQRAKSAASITVDAGDFMTGNPICNIEVEQVLGGGLVDMLNQLGIDAGVIGNHEFDNGRENAKKLCSRANYPVMALDIRNEKKDLEFPAKPVILERGGLKVGVIGVSCAGNAETVADTRFAGLWMDDQETVVRQWIKTLDPKTDLLVLITHNGVHGDTLLARELVGSGLDVMIGGHSHTRLKKPLLIGDVLVCQAGGKMKNLGRLDLKVEDDRVVQYNGRLITLLAEGREGTPELTALVDKYSGMVEAEYGQVIGRLQTAWKRTSREESNVGDWLCDAMRAAGKTDIALLNSGTIRKNFEPGPLTLLDINEMLPFANMLETFEIDGRGLRKIALENARAQEDDRHGIMQIAGMRYAYTAEDGDVRVTEITVSGNPVDPDHVYTVACPDYLAMKADVYMKMPKPETKTMGRTITDVIVDAVRSAGSIDARVDGRITRN